MLSMTRKNGKMTLTSDEITSGDTIILNYSDLPFVIKDAEGYERALAVTEHLFFKQDRTASEDQLLGVWTVLIEMYEEEAIPLGSTSTPASILNSLMEARDMSQADLVREGVGSSGVVSEIANGKRAISKEQARKLADIFHVSPTLFIY